METKRLYYMDWLRVLVVLSVTPFHAALTYLRFGSVYIKAPVLGSAALPFLLVIVPFADFFMGLLFFVAGMASYYSFKKRGVGPYIRERVTKLLLPFLLGLFFLCPPTAYLKALYEGFEGGFLKFIPQFFWYKALHYQGYGHLWFLLYLYVFSMVCVPLFKRWKRDESRMKRIGDYLTQGHRLLFPMGAIVLFEILLRPFFHGAQTLVLDWASNVVYLSLFVFGYVFAAEERIQEKLRDYFKPSIVTGLLSLAVLFYVNIMWQVFGSDALHVGLLWVVTRGVYVCSAIIIFINIGANYLNQGSKTLAYLSKASFAIYFFHFLPVTIFTLLLIDLPVHRFVNFLLVVVLSYAVLFLSYELWRRVVRKRKGMG